jgi:hypothetical protein
MPLWVDDLLIIFLPITIYFGLSFIKED